VPLLGAAVLVALPIAAFVSGTASGLLRGLFDLAPLSLDGSVIQFIARAATTCFFTWLAYSLAAIALYQSAAIILDFAPGRLDVATPFAGRWLERRAVLPIAVLCGPALLASWVVSLERCARVLAMAAGGVLASILVVALLAAVRRRTRRASAAIGSSTTDATTASHRRRRSAGT